MIIPEANREFVAERLQCDPDWPIGLSDGTSTEVDGFKFTAVPAAHEELETDEQGRHKFLGYVVQFGPYTIYHSGDTVRYPGMVEKLAPFDIDVAILPINGSKPERRVPGNLNGAEAAQLAKDINAKLTIPCHYHMFEFNTVEPEEFTQPADELGINYRVLQAGERWSSRDLLDQLV
jgi:L-ascorbate metabolism protein UlaG (beta-lactamase superfamily)